MAISVPSVIPPASLATPPIPFQPIIIDEFDTGMAGSLLYCSITSYGGRYWFAESDPSLAHYAFFPNGTITTRAGSGFASRIQAAVEVGTYVSATYWHIDGAFRPNGEQETQVGWTGARGDWLMDAGHLQVSLRRSGVTTLRLGPHQASPDSNVLLEENLANVPIDPLAPAGAKVWVPGQEHRISLRFDPTPSAERVWLFIHDRNVVDLVDRVRGAAEPRQSIDVSGHARLAAFKAALSASPWVVIASVDAANGIVNDGTVVNTISVHTDGTLVTPPQDLPECAYGACCRIYTCIEHVSETTCRAAGGTWNGGQSTCDDIRCCPDPFADFDADGDVDMTDFAHWQRCFTGDSGAVVSPECVCLDWDGDGQIDRSSDLTTFLECARGPNVAADPTCDGNGE